MKIKSKPLDLLQPTWLGVTDQSQRRQPAYLAVQIRPHPDCCGLHLLYNFGSHHRRAYSGRRPGEEADRSFYTDGPILNANAKQVEKLYASLADALFSKLSDNMNYHAITVAEVPPWRRWRSRWNGKCSFHDFLEYCRTHRKRNWRISKIGGKYRNPNTSNLLQQWRLSRYEPEPERTW